MDNSYKLGVCTVYPPGSKATWRIRYFEGTHRRERRAKSQKEAEAIAIEITANVTAPTGGESLTVTNLADSYLHTLGEGNYRDRQEGILQRWVLPRLGGLLLPQWMPAHSRQVLQAMADAGLSGSRVKNAAQVMRGLISHAQAQGWYTAFQDPLLKVWPQIRFPFVEEAAQVEGESADFIDRDTLPTRDDIDLMIKAAPTPEWGLAWKLASYSGLRWGEIVGLRGADIDLERRIVHVRRSIEQLSRDATRRVKSTKNKKQRFSIFPASMVEELRERKEAVGPKGLMFPDDDGESYAERQLHRRRWIRAAQRAGWPFLENDNPSQAQLQWPRPRWTFHDLRHFAACWMIFDLKAPLAEVTTWLGHHAISFTFDKYVGRRGDIIQKGLDLTEDW